MIKELMSALPTHQDYMETLNGKVLYIVDWKDENNGGISFSDTDSGRAAVRLLNPHEIFVCCDKFAENALPIKKGCFSQQCECVLFPQEDSVERNNWVLFIETKYAKDESKARNPQNNYPGKMVEQIEATVEYFRNKGILEEDKIVYAIVSFPMLDNYNAWFDQNLIHDAWTEHQVVERATNQALIYNKQMIRL